jgi:hypothetical protein
LNNSDLMAYYSTFQTAGGKDDSKKGKDENSYSSWQNRNQTTKIVFAAFT